MLKRKLISLSLIAIIGLSACGSDNASNSTSTNDTQQAEHETSEVSEVSASEIADVEKKTDFITKGFETLLNYDNTNYEQRAENLKKYFTEETYTNMISNEHLDTSVEFVSTSENYQVYKHVGDENQFVVILDTTFQVSDNDPTPFTNIYEVTLTDNDGTYIISGLQTTPKQQITMIP